MTQLASSNKVPYLEFGIGAYREPILLEGQWKVDYGTTCSSYPFEIDGAWKASKAFYFLALVIGGGGTVFLWCSTCFVFSRGTWRWSAYEIVAASLCQLLGFLWFRNAICQDSSNSCQLGAGSKGDVAATILWIISALLALCKYPSPKEDIQDDEILTSAEVHVNSPPSSPAAALNHGIEPLGTPASIV